MAGTPGHGARVPLAERLNRYTTIEAEAARERGECARAPRALVMAAREAAGRYFKRGGWRDGWRGAAVAASMACYRLAAAVKLRELEVGVTSEQTAARYRTLAEEVLRDYEAPSSAASR